MTNPEIPSSEPSQSPSDDIRELHRLVNKPVIPGQSDDYGTYFEVPGPETLQQDDGIENTSGEPAQQGLFDIKSDTTVGNEPNSDSETVADKTHYDVEGRSPGAQRAQKEKDRGFWRNQGR